MPVFLTALQQTLPPPVVVKIVEPDNGDPTGLSQVLIGALGLTGVLILGCVVLAVLFAALLLWRRSRAD